VVKIKPSPPPPSPPPPERGASVSDFSKKYEHAGRLVLRSGQILSAAQSRLDQLPSVAPKTHTLGILHTKSRPNTFSISVKYTVPKQIAFVHAQIFAKYAAPVQTHHRYCKSIMYIPAIRARLLYLGCTAFSGCSHRLMFPTQFIDRLRHRHTPDVLVLAGVTLYVQGAAVAGP